MIPSSTCSTWPVTNADAAVLYFCAAAPRLDTITRAPYAARPHATASPSPAWPTLTLAQVRDLVAPALTIALLAAIESLLSAVVDDGMIGGRHKSNMELVAQGVATIAAPLSGMVHAATLLLILVAFGRWAKYIPLTTIAAILMVVAYNMSEWHACRAILRGPKSDIAVLVVTFGLKVGDVTGRSNGETGGETIVPPDAGNEGATRSAAAPSRRAEPRPCVGGSGAGRGEVVSDAAEVRPGPRVGGDLQPPLAGRANELPGEGEDPASRGLGSLHHPPAEGVPLVEDEQVVGEDFQIEVGRVGPEAAGGGAVEPEVRLEFAVIPS